MTARVLVVDDEENLAYVVGTALRLAGFEVTTAATGRAALDAVQTTSPDLVVLDVMLPDVDGFEICRRLRHDHIDTPVIFLTARDGIDDRLRGLTIGGDDYVVKPFGVEELIARVRVVLRRVGRGGDQPALRCGDVELDEEAHRVTKAGREVPLSPTEFRLLRFLLRNQGRALSRAQILDHVWDYDFDGESTVVETYVSALRRKIDAGDARMIHTVRGIGYRLDAPA